MELENATIIIVIFSPKPGIKTNIQIYSNARQ